MTAVAAAAAFRAEEATLSAAADPFVLAEANINPITGLSTDYLNHFNEAVMLLEMIPLMPECRQDLLAWQPSQYSEHFAASRLRQRNLAIAAYGRADTFTRIQFDRLCEAMNATVMAVREALSADISAATTAALSQQGAVWLKALIARTSAVIHGLDVSCGETPSIQDSQAAVDALFEP